MDKPSTDQNINQEDTQDGKSRKNNEDLGAKPKEKSEVTNSQKKTGANMIKNFEIRVKEHRHAEVDRLMQLTTKNKMEIRMDKELMRSKQQKERIGATCIGYDSNSDEETVCTTMKTKPPKETYDLKCRKKVNDNYMSGAHRSKPEYEFKSLDDSRKPIIEQNSWLPQPIM